MLSTPTKADVKAPTQADPARLTGLQALARLPVEIMRAERRAGRNTAGFISGYEGSPLGGYDMELHRHQALLDEYGIIFQPGVNEELAATAVQGSQLASASQGCTVDGVIGFWYGKSPGLDRASDAFRHNALMGVPANGGGLIFVGDDASAKSSTVPGASERLLADLGIPTLYPADPQQILDLGVHAAAMSRSSGLWVALKISTDVANGSMTVDVTPGRVVPVGPVRAVDHAVTATMMHPMLAVLESSRDGERRQAALDYAARNNLDMVTAHGALDSIGIIAAGPTFLHVREALRRMGLDDIQLKQHGIRLLQLGMIDPIEPCTLKAFASGLQKVVVVEDKRPFIETAARDLLYPQGEGGPLIVGKRNIEDGPVFPIDAELTADIIAPVLAEILLGHSDFTSVREWLDRRQSPKSLLALPLITRSPYFCSGCPHNSSTKVPDGSLVGAGIGCHGLVTLMDEKLVGSITGLTQMGGEGAQWIGMSPFIQQSHLIQNVGDGTFHHSGSLAVRAAVAAGSHITYKILYNSAVAMTGGQRPEGALAVKDLAQALLAEGVTRIIVTTDDPKRYRRRDLPHRVRCWHRDRLDEAQRTLAATPGVTVIIHDQECATELRRKRKRGKVVQPIQRVMINERVCEGCGDCGAKSNCLSVQPIETEFGRKTRIDQSSCNFDFSCLNGDCPAFMTIVPSRSSPAKVALRGLETADLPEPPRLASEPHTTRITGIGGSGVVTVAQTLAAAATIAGRYVRTLDQTGLAQKGGPVVSDVKIFDQPTAVANRAGEGECDLYLGCDLLVAAEARHLLAADPHRTVAVISSSAVPTGQMVVDPDTVFPAVSQAMAPILRATRAEHAVVLDARRLATTLFGQDQFANMLLVGAAYQTGRLPLRAQHIEEAIRASGIKVQQNLQAFRRGRQAVAAPADLDAAVAQARKVHRPKAMSRDARRIAAIVQAGPESPLGEDVAVRVFDLIAYQGRRYAQHYAEFVERVRVTEATRAPGVDDLTRSVARNLHKLMAYKDEYEVPRLCLDQEVDARVREAFGSNARVSYKLHPPFLRAMGMNRKLTLGPWVRPFFRALAALRFLRGSFLDPFGHTQIRRLERQLIVEYRAWIDAIAIVMTPENHALAVRIAELPDIVRGYEEVKLANVARYRKQAEQLISELRMTVPQL